MYFFYVFELYQPKEDKKSSTFTIEVITEPRSIYAEGYVRKTGYYFCLIFPNRKGTFRDFAELNNIGEFKEILLTYLIYNNNNDFDKEYLTYLFETLGLEVEYLDTLSKIGNKNASIDEIYKEIENIVNDHRTLIDFQKTKEPKDNAKSKTTYSGINDEVKVDTKYTEDGKPIITIGF